MVEGHPSSPWAVAVWHLDVMNAYEVVMNEDELVMNVDEHVVNEGEHVEMDAVVTTTGP